MTAERADPRVPRFLGRVLTADGVPVGTCFQVAPRVLVTAWHVLEDLDAGREGCRVDVDALAGGLPVRSSKVVRVDALHDVAVLVRDEPLGDSAVHLVATDSVQRLARVRVTGVPRVDDPGHVYRFLDASGVWQGGTMRDEAVALGRLSSSAVVPGMSGAPVLRDADDAVAGVVSARYNSLDGWLRDSVWVARVEDLLPLLDGLAAPVVRHLWLDRAGAEVTLVVEDSRVVLRASGVEVAQPHAGVSAALVAQVDRLRQTRAHLMTVLRGAPGDATTRPRLAGVVGGLLAQSFLPASVGDRLAELVGQATARHLPVRLGVRVAGGWARLPWETLELPGTGRPAALHELVRVYRQVDTAAVDLMPGPLRILVAIASPLSGGSGVLDYERELRNVLAAVRSARVSQAQVRIVHFATTAAIHAALEQAPVHVLHLSGHGSPGRLELEDDDGVARPVSAETFVMEAIPPGRMPPVVALAACHTDVSTAAGDPSFAAGLVARGARVVIATETAITDVYATRVFARVYGHVAATPHADVVAAVAAARVAVQRELQDSHDEREHELAELDEWSVLTVLSATGEVPLIDPDLPPLDAATVEVSRGVLRRDVGEVVGRRREQRRWPMELLAAGTAGIVIHGIGGVGKTTLADEVSARALERDPERLVVTAVGQISGAQLLDTVTADLAMQSAQTRWRNDPRIGPALAHARDGSLPWAERVAALCRYVFAALPVLLVLDNFEDNLTDTATGPRQVADETLAGVLAALCTAPGQCRLLITSRYRFTLPNAAHRVLSFKQLGPLTLAETLKLAWALPQLDRLTDGELEQVWRSVGQPGHPAVGRGTPGGGTGRHRGGRHDPPAAGPGQPRSVRTRPGNRTEQPVRRPVEPGTHGGGAGRHRGGRRHVPAAGPGRPRQVRLRPGDGTERPEHPAVAPGTDRGGTGRHRGGRRTVPAAGPNQHRRVRTQPGDRTEQPQFLVVGPGAGGGGAGRRRGGRRGVPAAGPDQPRLARTRPRRDAEHARGPAGERQPRRGSRSRQAGSCDPAGSKLSRTACHFGVMGRYRCTVTAPNGTLGRRQHTAPASRQPAATLGFLGRGEASIHRPPCRPRHESSSPVPWL
ncbi:MAG: CHAT domain-containing protein [Actinobacteria bacterium]|nr:MAG: CHAT domain-containing protein [Actinomycetota bacterium]